MFVMLPPMGSPLLSIAEARERVLAAVTRLEAEELPVERALGRVLAEDLIAASDVPGFASSAMDGFAVRSGPAGRELRVAGEARAGHPAQVGVSDGEAIRISTGAAMPGGADAVLQIELVDDRGDHVVLRDDVAHGRNVRGAGEDLRAGDRVLPAGALLGPAQLGIAVHAGRAGLRCARRPRVAVLATGDELAPPGAALAPGQVHDSNRVTISALAQRDGAELVLARDVPDEADATREAIAGALERCDVLLLSGGVSVGPHDHVKPALAQLGAEERFWRVALRPGKPTWFGVRGEKLVFGLPGNPVSAMVTYLLFARPALAALQGAEPPVPARVTLGRPLKAHAHRDECVRVRVEDGRAYSTGPQGSHILRSMALADGLVIVPRGEGLVLAEGTEVELLAI
jgi:molybdopterin molybdotransferase